ncbi:WD40 repeat domain 95 [Cichlidogyrus casuarinus]|uniref:WD40 repeat domain 95 n=1 Tax=Cichlidogyrus casuarinus TaxID=1844966 RepID=A0ABD2QDK5_9PLAT
MQTKTRKYSEQTVFRVYKGINTFDFSIQHNLLATGGMDRYIRLWNPYMNSKPIGILRGMNAPVQYLSISAEDTRLFAIGTDKILKVWDIIDQKLLSQVRPKGHKIRGELDTCFYSAVNKALVITTDQVNFLPVKVNPFIAEAQWWKKHSSSQYFGGSFIDPIARNKDSQKRLHPIKQTGPSLTIQIVPTHTEDVVTCLAFNPTLGYLLSGSYSSVIKVWDVLSGAKIHEFEEAHGDQPITRMTFDVSFSRLISAGRDGSVRMWNFNNGHCICQFVRSDPTVAQLEMSDVIYIDTTNNQFIVAVGWDRRINVFIDPYPVTSKSGVKAQQRNTEANDSVTTYSKIMPENAWPDDLVAGHQNDILSIASGPPRFIATGDYSGQVLVWNMISGHIFCRLNAFHTKPAQITKNNFFNSDSESDSDQSEEENVVTKLANSPDNSRESSS